MTTKDIIKNGSSLFDSIRQINEYGDEFWTARALLGVLGYNEYRFFKNVIEKAKIACSSSNMNVSNHIVQVHTEI